MSRGTVFASLAAVTAAANLLSAQQPSFRTDVALVGVDVSVVDADGRTVAGLSKEEFIVLDEGEPRPVRFFSDVTAPYHVLLLFDRSGSTRIARPQLEDAVLRLYGTLRAQDRVAVASFFSDVDLLENWHAPTPDVPTAVRGLHDDSSRIGAGMLLGLFARAAAGLPTGTNLYGALEWALRKVRDVKQRVCVIVLTDGVDDRSYDNVRENGVLMARFMDLDRDRSFQASLRAARAGGVPFYFVAVNTDLNPTPPAIGWPAGARHRMEEIAAASGGRVALPRTPDEVVTLYEGMAREIATAYSLAYEMPPNAAGGTVRRVDVRVRDTSLRVRQSRATYQPR